MNMLKIMTYLYIYNNNKDNNYVTQYNVIQYDMIEYNII